jgi:hypothetical protein
MRKRGREGIKDIIIIIIIIKQMKGAFCGTTFFLLCVCVYSFPLGSIPKRFFEPKNYSKNGKIIW